MMQLADNAALNPERVVYQNGDSLGARWKSLTLLAGNAGFWPALAATVRTIVTGHRGKTVVPRRDPESVGITGYSLAEVEALLQTMSKPGEQIVPLS